MRGAPAGPHRRVAAKAERSPGGAPWPGPVSPPGIVQRAGRDPRRTTLGICAAVELLDIPTGRKVTGIRAELSL